MSDRICTNADDPHLVLERPFHLLVADGELCSEGNLKKVSVMFWIAVIIDIARTIIFSESRMMIHLINFSLLYKFCLWTFRPVHLYLEIRC